MGILLKLPTWLRPLVLCILITLLMFENLINLSMAICKSPGPGSINSVVFFFLLLRASLVARLTPPCFFIVGPLICLFYFFIWMTLFSLIVLLPVPIILSPFSPPNFPWRMLGIHIFMGVQVACNFEGIFLTQHKYIHNLLHKFDPHKLKYVLTPLPSRTTLSLMDGELLSDPTEYHGMVGGYSIFND